MPFDALHDEVRAEGVDNASKKIGAGIRSAVKWHRNLTRNYESPKSQRKRLYFDPGAHARAEKKGKKLKKKTKKLYGRESKAVLTAGIVVVTFDWAERLGHPLQLSEVKEFLETRGGQAFWGNQVKFYKSGINEAWKEKREIAHLCAAFAVFIDQHAVQSDDPGNPWRRFSSVEESELIRTADEFLACAKWFEEVLRRVQKRAHATMKLDLRSLPEWLSLQPLPDAGVVMVPDRFNKALVAWLDKKQ